MDVSIDLGHVRNIAAILSSMEFGVPTERERDRKRIIACNRQVRIASVDRRSRQFID